MQSNFQDIAEFHETFGLVGPLAPMLLDQDTMAFRLDFLNEELDEIRKGHAEQDIAQIADGLIDLVYVAMGTAYMMGLPWQNLWDEVQRANMGKVRATDPTQSKRGSSLDVVKPEGWVGPNIEKVLEDAESAELTNILREADELIHGERVAKYGDARETFGNVARIFSLITKTDLSGEHVALLQLILKLVRNSHSPENIDHLTDAAGYIGLMSEIQQADASGIDSNSACIKAPLTTEPASPFLNMANIPKEL